MRLSTEPSLNEISTESASPRKRELSQSTQINNTNTVYDSNYSKKSSPKKVAFK